MVAANNRLVTGTIRTLIAVSLVSLLIALMIGAALSRVIVRPMRAMVHSAGRIADCDLTVQDMQIRNRDEIGDLGAAFHRMKANLHRVIVQVGHSTEQVAAAADTLSANSSEADEYAGA